MSNKKSYNYICLFLCIFLLLVIFAISLLIESADSQFSPRLSSLAFLLVLVAFSSFVYCHYYSLKQSRKQKNIRHRKIIFLILFLSVILYFIIWLYVYSYIADNFYENTFHILNIWSTVALLALLAFAFVINIEYTDLVISKLKKSKP